MKPFKILGKIFSQNPKIQVQDSMLPFALHIEQIISKNFAIILIFFDDTLTWPLFYSL